MIYRTVIQQACTNASVFHSLFREKRTGPALEAWKVLELKPGVS
jgi:hypothetical protein